MKGLRICRSRRRTLATRENDTDVVYEYDIADRLTGLTNNVNSGDVVDFDYADYDKVGNHRGYKIDNTPGLN